jgi:hypothetical protein
VRWRTRIALALAGLLAVVACFGIPRLRTASAIGAGYLAKVACSCVYIAGRDLAACRADLPAYLGTMEAELLPDPGGVRARSALFGIERVARYTEGRGCTLLSPLLSPDGAGRAEF